jgi:hypothetical protein
MLSKFINSMMMFMISFTLIFFPVVHADTPENGTVVTIEEGQVAPFSGTLFSTAASAKLLAEIQLSNESCQIRIDRELDISSARFQLEIDNINAALDASNLRYTQVTSLKDDHIDFLDHQLQRSSNPNNELWLAVGVVSGLLLGMGAAWSYGQIANN